MSYVMGMIGCFLAGVLTGVIWVVRCAKVYLVNTTPDGRRYALGNNERVWLEDKKEEETNE